MSNLNNLQARLITLSKQLAEARGMDEVDDELVEDLEDMIADIEDEIEGILADEYDSKHGAQWN
jgi:cob(I)alamin adenosyltransferase